MSEGGAIHVLGAGAATAHGDLVASYEAWCAGRSAPAGREVELPPDLGLPRDLEGQARLLNGAGRLLVGALAGATARLRGTWTTEDDATRGLYLALVDAGNWDCHDFTPTAIRAAEEAKAGGPPAEARWSGLAARHTRPSFLLEGLRNNASSFVAAWLHARGPNTASSGGTGPAAALLDAALRHVRAERMATAIWGASVRADLPVAQHERRLLEASAPRLAALPVRGNAAGALVLGRVRPDGSDAPPLRLVAHAIGRARAGGPGRAAYGADAADWAALAARLGPGADGVADWIVAGAGGEVGLDAARAGLSTAGKAAAPAPLEPVFGDVGGASEALGLALLALAASRGRLPQGGWAMDGRVGLAVGGDGGLAAFVVARVPERRA